MLLCFFRKHLSRNLYWRSIFHRNSSKHSFRCSASPKYFPTIPPEIRILGYALGSSSKSSKDSSLVIFKENFDNYFNISFWKISKFFWISSKDVCLKSPKNAVEIFFKEFLLGFLQEFLKILADIILSIPLAVIPIIPHRIYPRIHLEIIQFYRNASRDFLDYYY